MTEYIINTLVFLFSFVCRSRTQCKQVFLYVDNIFSSTDKGIGVSQKIMTIYLFLAFLSKVQKLIIKVKRIKNNKAIQEESELFFP